MKMLKCLAESKIFIFIGTRSEYVRVRASFLAKSTHVKAIRWTCKASASKVFHLLQDMCISDR